MQAVDDARERGDRRVGDARPQPAYAVVQDDDVARARVREDP